MDQDQILEVLLKQNQQLIDALTRSSPVEILKALNPAPVQVQYRDPWKEDETHPQPPEDPWGDPNLTNAEVLEARGGWTEPPFKIPTDANTSVREEVDSGEITGTESSEG